MGHGDVPDHRRFMGLAVRQAEHALRADEVPVGCVLVYRGEVVAETHNLTNRERDPLCHAEYRAALEFFGVRDGAQASPRPGFVPAQLVFYITMEPCVMCHGILERIGAAVYFGCYNDIFGTRRLTGGCAGTHVPDPRCVELMREFYARENAGAPEEKRARKPGRTGGTPPA